MIQGFSHVGIAVKDLDEAVAFFEDAFSGVLISRTTYEDQNIESAFVQVGSAHFELIASTDPEGLIFKFIENRGEGIHHLSLQVDNFDEVIRGLKAKGLKVISEADTKNFKLAFILDPCSLFNLLRGRSCSAFHGPPSLRCAIHRHRFTLFNFRSTL